MIRPNSVNVVKIDGEVLPKESVRATGQYICIYFILLIFSALLISVDGFSFETNITAAITSINNVGPGLDMIGPMGSFHDFSPFSKLVLSFTMLFGRLEIMPMLILFSPGAWKKR